MEEFRADTGVTQTIRINNIVIQVTKKRLLGHEFSFGEREILFKEITHLVNDSYAKKSSVILKKRNIMAIFYYPKLLSV